MPVQQQQQQQQQTSDMDAYEQEMMAIIAARSRGVTLEGDDDWKIKQQEAELSANSQVVRIPPFPSSSSSQQSSSIDGNFLPLWNQRGIINPLIGGEDIEDGGAEEVVRSVAGFSTEPPREEDAELQQQQEVHVAVGNNSAGGDEQYHDDDDEDDDDAGGPSDGDGARQEPLHIPEADGNREEAPGPPPQDDANNATMDEEMLGGGGQPLVEAVLVHDDADDDITQHNGGTIPPDLARGSTGFMTIDSEVTVVEAKPVTSASKSVMSRRVICVIMGMLFLVIAALSIGFAVSAKNKDTNSDNAGENSSEEAASIVPTSTPLQGEIPAPSVVKTPVLERLAGGAKLRCGVMDGPGLFFYREDGTPDGFDASLCAAVAAAATGDPRNVEYKTFQNGSLMDRLAKDEIDIISAGVTHTMERQVYRAQNGMGFTFSRPYLYQGLQIAGEPSLVRCGDEGLDKIAACGDIRVCSTERSTHFQMLSSFLPGKQLIPVPSRTELRAMFVNGTCNVIAHEGYNLAPSLVREAGYEGEYLVGETLFSKEPLAMVTHPDDPAFSDFVNSVLNALIVAEMKNITQSTADSYPLTEALAGEYAYMFRDAIAAVGNIGELFERYMEKYTERQGLNLPYDGMANRTGLLYSHPFGNAAEEFGFVGDTLAVISERKMLRCGVRPNRPSFAVLEYDSNESVTLISATGLEVDYCHALAASIFDGDTMRVDFIEVADQQEGLALLASDDLDVFAGALWNLQNDIRVPGINEGFALTQPIFYGEGGEILCLATRQDDHQWSAFVYWIAAAIVHAEEEGITQGMSNVMPEVSLFGPYFQIIFQDAILAVGNYGEMYDRNFKGTVGRSGRNKLNDMSGPQLYPLPGVFD